MTAPVTLVRPAPVVLDDEPPFIHYVCEIHEFLALCGVKLRNHAIAYDEDTDVDCPLCQLADKQGVDCAVPGCRGRRGRLRSLIHRLTGRA